MSDELKSDLRKFIMSLCSGKTEEELQEAEQRFRDFLLVAKEICDRYAREGKNLPALTTNKDSSNMV